MKPTIVNVPSIKDPIKVSRRPACPRKLSTQFKGGAEVWPRVYEAIERGAKSSVEVGAALNITGYKAASAMTRMKKAGMLRKIRREVWETIPREQWPADRGKHSVTHAGPESPSWKGGRYVNEEGYVLVKVGLEHAMADVRGYVYEHRLVMSKTLGRPLRSDEQVHHRDENRQNNDPSNLEVLTLPEHKVHHRTVGFNRRLPGEENPEIACACRCGQTFPKFDRWGRPRATVSGHNRAVRSTEAA